MAGHRTFDESRLIEIASSRIETQIDVRNNKSPRLKRREGDERFDTLSAPVRKVSIHNRHDRAAALDERLILFERGQSFVAIVKCRRRLAPGDVAEEAARHKRVRNFPGRRLYRTIDASAGK